MSSWDYYHENCTQLLLLHKQQDQENVFLMFIGCDILPKAFICGTLLLHIDPLEFKQT